MMIGICDDEKKCMDMTIECCERIREELELDFEYLLFSSGQEMLACDKEMDLLFLDVELEDLNGMDCW